MPTDQDARPDTTAPFAAALRQATSTSHEDAATSSYMTALVSGDLDLAAYAELTAQHWFMYVELEAAAAIMRDEPVAGTFVFDSLTRIPHLEADLQFLLGDRWRDRIRPTESNERYCNHIRAVASTWPGGFVAHHYTRYLGDLSGGQFVRGAIERVYGLQSGDGVRFYRFDDLGDPTEFKDEYRRRLDAVPWEADEQRRVIDEVIEAYRFNTEVLHDLDRMFG
jgi:heme oxygenase